MLTWAEFFAETCPNFSDKVNQLKETDDVGLNEEWLRRKANVLHRIHQVEVCYPDLTPQDRNLLRVAMQRFQKLRDAKRDRMITEETRATAFMLMMIISTKLASVFEQFYYSMVEVEYLLFEKAVFQA